MAMGFKFIRQYDSMDCGPTCLKMICHHYGKDISLEYLREICYINKQGVSLMNLYEAGRVLGFETEAYNLATTELEKNCPLPCIVHWNQEHFVVLYDIKVQPSLIGNDRVRFYVANPAYGKITLNKENFSKYCVSHDDKVTVLLFNSTEKFHSIQEQKNKSNLNRYLFNLLMTQKRYLLQIAIGMLGASILTLCFPFLTQFLVDQGVQAKNLSLIYMILLMYIFLFLGSVAIDITQNWLMLHVNARISLSILSQFLSKLLKLPIKFFDSKDVGDITQRVNDHGKIETFLTGTLLNSVFSLLNIVVFTVVLGFYSINILLIFILLSTVAVLWVFLFQKKRADVDHERFSANKVSYDRLIEIIFGMQEVKLNGCETKKRLAWEDAQLNVFKINIKGLRLEQFQTGGFSFLSQLKNILLLFLAGFYVTIDKLSLGQMLAISYIIGQTNGPLQQLVNLIKASQDAKLSLNRMNEVFEKRDEDDLSENNKITKYNGDIVIDEISYQYQGPSSAYVLKDFSLVIPKNKVTAIVGESGSGKTTLMKILLKFYTPQWGKILIDGSDLSLIPATKWRENCGVVMQNGYIFSDSVENNIALATDAVDQIKLTKSLQISMSTEFVNALPRKSKTKIGSTGMGLSGGQKQRLFIARAIYKDADYLFLDEATSSLDSNNEKAITSNLKDFYQKKTVLIIAHRLSTVKEADKIVVLNKGKIVETGTHVDLVKRKGYYYNLIKNQLELGD